MKTAKRKPMKIETHKGTMRDRIGRLFRRCVKIKGKYTFSMFIVSSLVLLYAVAVNHRRSHDPAQLKFVEPASPQIYVLSASGAEPVKPVFSGEAYETALRLRECGALLMAISLASFDEFRVNGKLPASVSEVLMRLQTRSLLPPGIEIIDGSLRSSFSEIAFRYRSDPFSFEIVSLPGAGVDGPVLLFRFPLPSGDANTIVYFQSRAQTPAAIPGPFSSIEQLAASGWSIARWRGEALPLDESTIRDLQEQEEWLRTQTQGR